MLGAGCLAGMTRQQHSLSHDPLASSHIQHTCFALPPNPAPLWILGVQGVLKLLQKGGHGCADGAPVFLRPPCVKWCLVKGEALPLQW